MATTKKSSMKALALLKANKSVSERAENYAVAVKRNIQRDVIDTLTAKKESIEDELFELTNFNLETDMNKGYQAMTKESVESRFKKVIDLEYKLKLIELELKTKQESFNKYFGDESSPQGQRIQLDTNTDPKHRPFLEKLYALCEQYQCSIEYHPEIGMVVLDMMN